MRGYVPVLRDNGKRTASSRFAVCTVSVARCAEHATPAVATFTTVSMSVVAAVTPGFQHYFEREQLLGVCV